MSIDEAITYARELGYQQGFKDGYSQGLADGGVRDSADDFKSRLLVKAGSASIEAVIEEAVLERERLLARIEGMEEAFRVFAAYEALATHSLTPEEEANLIESGVRQVPWGQVCQVSYRVVVKFGHNVEDYQVYGNPSGVLTFPGSLEELVQEVQPRIDALFLRAPLLEDIRSPSIQGLSDITFLKACHSLARYYWATPLQDQYVARRKEIFEEHIWPEIEAAGELDRDEALNLFGKKVKASFEAMQMEKKPRSERRGSTPPPPARRRA